MIEKCKFLRLNSLATSNLVIEKNNNVIIDDCENVDAAGWEAISQLLTPTLLIISATDLSSRLQANIRNTGIDPELIAYPIKGGLEVKKRLNIFAGVPEYDISSVRSSSTGFPTVILPEELERKLEKAETKKILIADDVIGTGITVAAIAQIMSYAVVEANQEQDSEECWRGKFPEWKKPTYGLPSYAVATWLKYEGAKGLECFGKPIDPIIYALEYKGQSGKPAVNSLSTLLRVGKKEDSIRNAYANKYSAKPNELIGLFKELGGF